MEATPQLVVQPPTSTRRHRTVEERRQIVEETLVPGVSVAAVARTHGINANLIFHWRKFYHAGLLRNDDAATTSASAVSAGCARLLPVTVSDVAPSAPVTSTVSTTRLTGTESAPTSGRIDLRLAKAHVSISGAVDVNTLRAVLECVLR